VLTDLARLRALLDSSERPVQMIFAGKAHPADRQGQDFIRTLFLLAQNEFRGKLVFLEDYDIEVGRMLVQGCDVWLNTPRRPQEASGTSGQKCPINGGINASILDGWWVEGYAGDNGWAIGSERPGASSEEQDREDAESLYRILEQEIVPAFYEKGDDGLRRRWIQVMKASIATCVSQFSAHRMVRDYVETTYLPAAKRRG
jgi:starch phosphorylase